MSASSLLVLVLWSAALLSERSWLLSVVDAKANSQLPDCTATADWGRCDRIHDGEGCPQVREGDKDCAQRSIQLQEHGSGCKCTLQNGFCDGEQARNLSASDAPSVNITYSVLNKERFKVTASVKNLNGSWGYEMMMTNTEATMIIGNRCTCGSTQNQKVSINRTAYFNNGVEDGSIHLCLRSSNGLRRHHLVQNFSIGSNCLDFVGHHGLPSHFCNQPIEGGLSVGRVGDLIVRPITSDPSTLQVSWTEPGIVDFLGLHGETYYLTLNSTLGIHTFNVSNSTNVTCTVRPGWNYTVSVRTWIWCENSSCSEQASKSAFVYPLSGSTQTSPATSPTSTSATADKVGPTADRYTTSPATSPTSTSATVDKVGPTADRYTTNAKTIAIICSVSTVAFVFLLIIVATAVYCKCRIKERLSHRYSGNEPCHVESSRARITNSCSTDSASTPHMGSISSNSDKISDLELDNHCPTSPTSIYSFSMEEHHALLSSKSDHDTSTVLKKMVLIVGSQRISTEELARSVAVPLMQYKGIEILMHGVDAGVRPEGLHGRLPPNKWVQRAMDCAEFVVCICNKEFWDDWHYNGEEMRHEVSLVGTLSQHIDGQTNHGQSNAVRNRFVVAILSKEDKEYIPDSLRVCNLFLLDCDAEVQRLGRFLLGTPAVRIDPISISKS